MLDACVLYPTVLREILLGAAEAGFLRPVWSPRLLDEWRRTAERLGGPADAALAEGEIARLRARFPGSEIVHDVAGEAALWLPDPADIHVLATARSAGAAGIVTLNLKDFPRRELQVFGLVAEHPDAVLRDLLAREPARMEAVVRAVHAEAVRLSGEALDLRALLKRARLPRLGKALTR